MAPNRVRRSWTTEEDAILRRAVNHALSESRPLLWRELAELIPGRSNKDCRRRWWNSLADGTVKGPWAKEEDQRLIEAVRTYGKNWPQVAKAVASRNSDQCWSHWSQVLDPKINFSDWTRAEDEALLHAVLTHGTNWSTIAAGHVPERTTLALKNRYSTLRMRHENSDKSKSRKPRRLTDSDRRDTRQSKQLRAVESSSTSAAASRGTKSRAESVALSRPRRQHTSSKKDEQHGSGLDEDDRDNRDDRDNDDEDDDGPEDDNDGDDDDYDDNDDEDEDEGDDDDDDMSEPNDDYRHGISGASRAPAAEPSDCTAELSAPYCISWPERTDGGQMFTPDGSVSHAISPSFTSDWMADAVLHATSGSHDGMHAPAALSAPHIYSTGEDTNMLLTPSPSCRSAAIPEAGLLTTDEQHIMAGNSIPSELNVYDGMVVAEREAQTSYDSNQRHTHDNPDAATPSGQYQISVDLVCHSSQLQAVMANISSAGTCIRMKIEQKP